MSSDPQASLPKQSFSLSRVLMVLVPALLLIGAVYVLKSREWEQQAHEKEITLLQQMGLATNDAPAIPMRLDEGYVDVDRDMVADPPQDPAKLISPAALTFAYVAGPRADDERGYWQEFVAELAKRAGKPVEAVAFKTTEEELHAMKDGKLHIAGFNTGNVQVAVNTCGFVPVCAAGRDDGSFAASKMQIIVPADSAIHSLVDLKGQTIGFTDRTSNSGYKAAIVFLRDRDLLPQRDYNWRFSSGHDKSIETIAHARRDFQAAAVASDMVQRAVANGTVELDKIRVIDSSKPFPPATVGYVYNLSPELAEKIKSACLEFNWSGTGLEKQFVGTGATKFVPISYKSDFEWTRLIADSVRDPPEIAELDDVVVEKPGQSQ